MIPPTYNVMLFWNHTFLRVSWILIPCTYQIFLCFAKILALLIVINNLRFNIEYINVFTVDDALSSLFIEHWSRVWSQSITFDSEEPVSISWEFLGFSKCITSFVILLICEALTIITNCITDISTLLQVLYLALLLNVLWNWVISCHHATTNWISISPFNNFWLRSVRLNLVTCCCISYVWHYFTFHFSS